MKMYMVGGAVRDEILGIKSKDIDYSVVLDGDDAVRGVTINGVADPFKTMVLNLQGMGFKIFLETPEHLTVRAQFPKGWIKQSYDDARDNNAGLTADFVLARKEGTYTDGRRPDTVEPGTLYDDLARRDFTFNAIAKDSDGTLIDPFNGQADIEAGIIRAVGGPDERLQEDALRAVRALRFSVTKRFTVTKENFAFPIGHTRGFVIAWNLAGAMESDVVLDSIRNNISDERIQTELSKMLRFDTVASLRALAEYPRLTEAMFAGSVSLDSTLKTKGRGKR